jgi:hypothetical protein
VPVESVWSSRRQELINNSSQIVGAGFFADTGVTKKNGNRKTKKDFLKTGIDLI